MLARSPNIQPEQGELVWSKIPEFAMAYNGYSVVIPYVEHYLNKVMREVKDNHCADNPSLAGDLGVFIQQEAAHARTHVQFNKRMYEAGYEGLKPLVEQLVAELKEQREKRSLAFNTAYCAGFESIATYDSRYLFEECDEYFEGADPHGANLLLWHVAEEFEHRAVCHNAFAAVSGNYFMRIYGLLYAFWHVGGTFVRAEQLILEHHFKGMTEQERRRSSARSKSLFWRQLRYVAPRMLRIFLPGYNPARLKFPPRMKAALEFFQSADPISQRFRLV
jgi:uncharacterized protein